MKQKLAGTQLTARQVDILLVLLEREIRILDGLVVVSIADPVHTKKWREHIELRDNLRQFLKDLTENGELA